MKYRISALNIFPVKSLSGIALEKSPAGEKGFRYDRSWMIVDGENRFITQRNFPQMSLLGVSILPEGIEIYDKRNARDKIYVLHTSDKIPAKVTVWGDVCLAEKYISPEVSDWLSRKTGKKCSLVFAPDAMKRKVDGRYSPIEVDTRFADSFPYLLANEASLNEVNIRAGKAFEMIRFRPNIVFEGAEPFQEDEWQKVKIGQVVFHVVKPCARCAIPTIDPESGKKGAEPLATLAAFRKQNNKILFGQNMVAENEGEIKTGDYLEVLEWKI